MNFSSVPFLFYFLPVAILVYSVSGRLRNIVLLFLSLLFYAWGEPLFVLLLALSILGNYLFGLAIADREGTRRRVALGLGIAANLLLLAWAKYATLLSTTITQFLHPLGINILATPDAHLPLGVSFYTFQAMSYLVDVFRRDAEAERRPLRVALYIAMFPQLIAGPIVRFKNITTQLRHRTFSMAKVAAGARYFIIGLSQKALIADTLAGPADVAFTTSADLLTTPLAWLGLTAFSLQIYFDFQGYSNMAIGLGLVFGFRLPRNFDEPYRSQSVTEFWRRWHITLSQWFRDYLYIPLGGNRRGQSRTLANLLVVFLLCGLWHGADWKFLVWGLYHGVFLVGERLIPPLGTGPVWRIARHTYAMSVIMVGWAIFRADSLSQAAAYLATMAGKGAISSLGLARYASTDVIIAMIVGGVAATGLLGSVYNLYRRHLESASSVVRTSMPWVETATLVTALFLCLLTLALGTHEPFLYFRF